MSCLAGLAYSLQVRTALADCEFESSGHELGLTSPDTHY